MAHDTGVDAASTSVAELQAQIDARLREQEEAELSRMIADARADGMGSAGQMGWSNVEEQAPDDPMLSQYMAEHKAKFEKEVQPRAFEAPPVDMDMDMTTELQKFQARINRTVANDIRRLLNNTKAYVKFHSPPPVLSQAHLRELAAPKPQLLHPDTLLARAVRDPSDYARVKAAQLAARRAAEEREAARQAQADTIKRENLKAYKQFKAQQEAEVAAVKEQQQQEQQQYGRAMSQYVRDKAREELAGYQARVQAQKARAAAVHEMLVQR